jgi:uncharacterized membrane protein YfcA
MVMDVKDAAAIVALTSIFNAIAILLTTKWEKIEWSAAGYMLAGSLLGIPLGVYALMNVPESAVKFVLAVVVISFAVYTLTRPPLAKLNSNVPGLGFGFIAGILGGAYNTSGPPLVIFGSLRQWPAERFRITMQAVSFPTSIVVAGLHSSKGLWTPWVVQSFLVALPFLIVAVWLGREINKRIDDRRFSRYVSCLLLVIGTVLIGTIVRDALGTVQ